MTPPLTADELAALPPKARRDPKTVAIYAEFDYLTAYAMHTDRRVLTEGIGPAAGADASRDNWDSHGELQRDFLITQGLRPEHCLLDIGCGGGRLARKVVPYLHPGNYHGVDISQAALLAAKRLARDEGWGTRRPRFWREKVDRAFAGTFDYLWAHSVVTHLSVPLIEDLMLEAARLLAPGGAFYWSYVPAAETVRYGLSQFKTTLEDLRACAERAGLSFEDVPDWVRSAGYEPGRWSYEQSVAVSRVAP